MTALTQIPDDILETLICSECSCYLSYGPIRIKIEGGPVCGRCLLPDNSFVSDTPYEKLAKMMYFPCRYKKYGCKHEDKFGEMKIHEDSCEFKEYCCPVVTNGSCQWIGSVKQILEHAENNHNDKVLGHPCVLPQNFTMNQKNVYITSSDDFLFLIHLETSIISRNIRHWVQIIAGKEYSKNFEFNLNIESPTRKLILTGYITSVDGTDLEEHALVTSITGLQEIFEKLEDFKIVVTVSVKQDMLKFKCSSCKAYIKKFVYCSEQIYKCEKCLPQLTACSKCYSYQDIQTKLKKHNSYFCGSVTHCQNCSSLGMGCSSVNLLQHIKNNHPDFSHNSNIFKAKISLPIQQFGFQFGSGTISTDGKKLHIINSEIGLVLCEFYKTKFTLNSNVIHFNIYSSLTSVCLNNYDCHLEIRRLDTNFKFETFLNRENGLDPDWTLKKENCNDSDYDSEVQIKITFPKRNIYKHPQLR